jgi:hypothetical protein
MKGLTSVDTIIVDKSTRNFHPRTRPNDTHAAESFADTSRKEYDADCATTAGPEKPDRVDTQAWYTTPQVEGGVAMPRGAQTGEWRDPTIHCTGDIRVGASLPQAHRRRLGAACLVVAYRASGRRACGEGRHRSKPARLASSQCTPTSHQLR